MDILRLFKTVLRRLPVIIGCSVLTAVLVIIFTINSPKEFVSSATIYTGFNTGYSPESVSQTRMNQSVTRSTFDNLLNVIKSRETLKEVGLRLLALHITLDKPDPKIISSEHFEYVERIVPADIGKLAAATPEDTYQNIIEIADTHPFFIAQVNYPTPYYSISALTSTIVRQVMNSDMVTLSYTSDDAGICQKTLEILIDVCIRNYRKINENQTDRVVAFCEEQLEIARENLRRSEEKDLQFKQAYNLVNYDVQTGIVINRREDILNQIHIEQEIVSATEAGIKSIESQLGTQAQILKNKDILDKKDQFGRLSTQLNMAELNNASPEQIASLQQRINQLKDELSRDMAASSASSPGNISNDMIISEYFTKMISYEESKARLKALESRKDAALGQYGSYLPLGDTLKRIQREISINEQAYMSALNELNQSRRRLEDQRSFSTVQIIDAPNYPLIAKSKRKMLVMLGAAIGFIIPFSIIFLLAYFNRDIKTPQRAEEVTGLKVGGIFPKIKQLQSLKKSEEVSDGLSDTILKNMYLSDTRQGQQRILIISTRPSEGKTTISHLLCERLIHKGRKCLVVVPYLDSGSWSVVNYKVDNAFYQSRAEDLVPVERLNEADILILELPSLIMNDYPVALIKEFNMAFLICDANREWAKADQTALDSFIKVSGITPYLILNEVDRDVVEEVLGKL